MFYSCQGGITILLFNHSWRIGILDCFGYDRELAKTYTNNTHQRSLNTTIPISKKPDNTGYIGDRKQYWRADSTGWLFEENDPE